MIGLAAHARDPEYHRGDEIGAHGAEVFSVQEQERLMSVATADAPSRGPAGTRAGRG